MSNKSASRVVTVGNPQGLHARPADLFVKIANQFSASVEVVKGNDRVDGKSILGILTLGAQHGTQLEINAVGPDSDEALSALAELVEQGFDERVEHN